MLEHGGRLREASVRYGIALERWLDLSTGINPCGWPVPALPAAAWSRLPEDEDGLDEAAHSYYGARALLPVAGSQAAIQALPHLRAPCRVAVIHPRYAEAYAWRRAGHTVTPVTAGELDNAVSRSDVLVFIHPNNPTGARFSPQQLLDWHAQLAARGGWLIVDEAFMDATPERSLAPYCDRHGLIVLRSLGKFFGLAGARVGFVLAEPTRLEQLRAQLGPWTVATPARWVAVQALRDRTWQETARQRLEAEANGSPHYCDGTDWRQQAAARCSSGSARRVPSQFTRTLLDEAFLRGCSTTRRDARVSREARLHGCRR